MSNQRRVNEKRCLAPGFVEPEAERLGEPIILARHRAEHHAPDDDVVEVREFLKGFLASYPKCTIDGYNDLMMRLLSGL